MIILLGPQRFKPTLARALDAHGVSGRVATITAGWQEREADDQELDKELGGRSVNLRLHSRGEEIFAEDPELKEAHRLKQERLQLEQDLYRLRLEHTLDEARVVTRRAPDSATVDDEWSFSIDEMRTLDVRHLERVRAFDADYEKRLGVAERPTVRRQRQEVAAILHDCAALVVAGGHVAVLLNRLKLFDVGALVGRRPIVAWSAGAMVLAERVVLFHDSPPQGAGVAQVLDEGLGRAPGVVALPSPRQRLRLDDRERVSLMARRFAPAACIALDEGAEVTFDRGRWKKARAVLRLDAGGEVDTGWAQ